MVNTNERLSSADNLLTFEKTELNEPKRSGFSFTRNSSLIYLLLSFVLSLFASLLNKCLVSTDLHVSPFVLN